MARKNRGPIAKPKPEAASPATSPAAVSPTTSAPGVGQSTPPSGGQLSVPPAAKPAEDTKQNSSAGQSSTQNSNDRGSFPGY
ncbi:hypothetical protein DB30_05372 [Enhygromyxa salina]|uniref:Sox C-terminal domain-containing protein n=2 Tax=Enhygromyxa salina TaxID=215803 RepID=A0A0C1ZD62_9BACT|nr:hypothetical protein DB30_05372 [Enhygromyxa salina]